MVCSIGAMVIARETAPRARSVVGAIGSTGVVANTMMVKIAESAHWGPSKGGPQFYWQLLGDGKMSNSFETWMKTVDQHVIRTVSLSADDLPDCCYRDWYESGCSPKEAAELAIENAHNS